MNIRKFILDKIGEERNHQVEKGYTNEKDSVHKENELLSLAMWRIEDSTAETPRPVREAVDSHSMKNISPDMRFKPCEETYKLIQAAALIVAELERRYREFEWVYLEEFFREKLPEDEE